MTSWRRGNGGDDFEDYEGKIRGRIFLKRGRMIRAQEGNFDHSSIEKELVSDNLEPKKSSLFQVTWRSRNQA